MGQAPVSAWTCPASLNFSSTVLAAAAWTNLPKRVPVLANPQEGSSMLKVSSALINACFKLVSHPGAFPILLTSVTFVGIELLFRSDKYPRQHAGKARARSPHSTPLQVQYSAGQGGELHGEVSDGSAFGGAGNYFETRGACAVSRFNSWFRLPPPTIRSRLNFFAGDVRRSFKTSA